MTATIPMNSVDTGSGAGSVHEYLLQGSILDAHVDHLLHRLKGLCDNVDSGPEAFHDHEICFSLRDPKQTANLQFRVRKALDVDVPYQLRYIGQPEVCTHFVALFTLFGMISLLPLQVGDRSRPTLVRSSIDVRCTRSILDFLAELGCRVDFEFINRGYMFRKGRMKVTVSKIFKGGPPPNEPISQSYIVELSVLAPSGQDSIADEIRNFSEQLKPLVQLEKIDYKRLAGV